MRRGAGVERLPPGLRRSQSQGGGLHRAAGGALLRRRSGYERQLGELVQPHGAQGVTPWTLNTKLSAMDWPLFPFRSVRNHVTSARVGDFRRAICAMRKVSDFLRPGWQRLGREPSPVAGGRRGFAIQYLPVRHCVYQYLRQVLGLTPQFSRAGRCLGIQAVQTGPQPSGHRFRPVHEPAELALRRYGMRRRRCRRQARREEKQPRVQVMVLFGEAEDSGGVEDPSQESRDEGRHDKAPTPEMDTVIDSFELGCVTIVIMDLSPHPFANGLSMFLQVIIGYLCGWHRRLAHDGARMPLHPTIPQFRRQVIRGLVWFARREAQRIAITQDPELLRQIPAIRRANHTSPRITCL